MPSDAERIILTVDHRNIVEALMADLWDLIPGLGEVTGAYRVSDAEKKGRRACALALATDEPLLDIVPANLICFLLGEREHGLGGIEEILPGPR